MYSLAEITIVSTAIQGMLLGCAIFLTVLTIFMLVRDPHRRRINHGMLAASCTLLALATAEFGIDIVRLIRGFITVGPNQPGGSWLFFYGVNDYTFIIKGCLYPVQILILDGVVIYRAYVAWQSLLAIFVPCIGWLGLFVSAIGLMYTMITIPQYPEAAYIERTPPWINALYASTLLTNFAATALLAFRLWRVNRLASEFQRMYSRLRILFRVVIESGLIYTILNLALLIAFRTNSPSLFYLRDALAPTVSIVFNMILVRVGFASSRKLSVLGIETTGAPSALEFPWRSDPERDADHKSATSRRKSTVVELPYVLGDNFSASSRDEVTDTAALELATRVAARPSTKSASTASADSR